MPQETKNLMVRLSVEELCEIVRIVVTKDRATTMDNFANDRPMEAIDYDDYVLGLLEPRRQKENYSK